jgi:hypothetical protein
VFADGRTVGALIDRNGLRPASFAITRDRLVAVASEAGAVPFAAVDTIRRGRLGPGELLLVEPDRRTIREDAEAKAWALRALPIHDEPRPFHEDTPDAAAARLEEHGSLDHVARYLVGVDAERARLDIKTMALEAHEPLWSMGDDTPTPGRGRLDRPIADHPPPGVRAGDQPGHRPRARADRHGPAGGAGPAPGVARRAAARTAHAPPGAPDRRRHRRPARAFRERGTRLRTLDATWSAGDGPAGLEAALGRLALPA